MNWYKHHLGDWDGATAHLLWIEFTAYIKLVHTYYRNEKPINHEDRYRVVGARNKWQRAAVDRVLLEFFKRKNDLWTNKRCDLEIKKYRKQARINKRIAYEASTKRNTNRRPNQIPDTRSKEVPRFNHLTRGSEEPPSRKAGKLQKLLKKKIGEKTKQTFEQTELHRKIGEALAAGNKELAERLRNSKEAT